MKYLKIQISLAILFAATVATNAQQQRKFVQTVESEASQRYLLDITKKKLLSCDSAISLEREYSKKISNLYLSCSDNNIELSNKFMAANKYYQSKIDSLNTINFILKNEYAQTQREKERNEKIVSHFQTAVVLSAVASFAYLIFALSRSHP